MRTTLHKSSTKRYLLSVEVGTSSSGSGSLLGGGGLIGVVSLRGSVSVLR